MKTLKETHQKKLAILTEQLNDNPDILREAIDQKQIDDIQRAVEKLTRLFSAPEFEELQSMRTGLSRAYENLTDLLAANRMTRWMKLGKELKDVGTFTTGVMAFLRQLPQIAMMITNSVNAGGNVNRDEPIAHILSGDQGTLGKLSSIIVKSLRPASFFGQKQLPYVDMEQIAFEVLGLSLNQIDKLKELSTQSRVVKKTLNPELFKSIDDALKSLGQPSKPDEANEQGQESTTTKQKLPTVAVVKQDFPVMFRAAVASAFPEREKDDYGRVKIGTREAVARDIFIKNIIEWLKEHGLIETK